MVEKHCADVVEMAAQCKETLVLLVIPNFYLVIVTTRDEQRLRVVERYSSNGS